MMIKADDAKKITEEAKAKYAADNKVVVALWLERIGEKIKKRAAFRTNEINLTILFESFRGEIPDDEQKELIYAKLRSFGYRVETCEKNTYNGKPSVFVEW